MKTKIVLLVLIGLTAIGCATGGTRLVPETAGYNLFVIVREPDRTRLSGATVTVGTETCITGDQGACRIAVPPGSYPMRVSAVGYETAESSVTVNTDVLIQFPLQIVE